MVGRTIVHEHMPKLLEVLQYFFAAAPIPKAIPPASISANSAAMTLSIRPISASRSVARGSSLPANVNVVRLETVGLSTK